MSAGGDAEGLAERVDRLGGDEEDPALAGVAAAVGSALATMAVALLVADGPLARLGDGSGEILRVPAGNQVGWAFLSAHGVPIHVTAEQWMLQGELVQSPVVYAVPPVTLFVGGYLVARLDGRASPPGGFRAGALTTIGYVLIAAVAVLATRHSVQSSYADVRIWADLVRGIWAGLAYPLAFGGAGGTLGGVVHERLGPGRHAVELVGLGAVGIGLAAAVAWAVV